MVSFCEAESFFGPSGISSETIRSHSKLDSGSWGTIAAPELPFAQSVGLWIRTHALTLAQIGMWIVGITIVALLALKNFVLRLFSWLFLPVGSIVLILACVSYFATEPAFSPFTSSDDLAVVITPANATVRAEPLGGPSSASDLAPAVIEAPPGTLCRPLAERGPWTYLELPDFTRGWLPSEHLSPIVPDPAGPAEPKELL